MKPAILLRIAAIIMLLHTVGHTFGTLGWKKTTDAKKQEVISQMTDNSFPFMGANHSFGDAMDGYGFTIILALLLECILLWMMASSYKTAPQLTKNILVTLGILLLLQGVIELKYFFPLAASFTLVSAVLTLISVTQIKKPG
jgi:hypothetical protein